MLHQCARPKLSFTIEEAHSVKRQHKLQVRISKQPKNTVLNFSLSTIFLYLSPLQ